MIDQLNVAQVGVGRWGMNIARTIREEVPGLKLHRVASRNMALGQRIDADCIVNGDWRELLHCGDISAVFLAVPSAFHLEMASAFVEAGIAVFVEKPMTLCVEDGEQLLRVVRASNGVVRVDHVDLHNPAVLEVWKVVKEMGGLRSIQGRIGASYDSRMDISPLWEYSPHFIAVCIEMNEGAPVSIQARRLPNEDALLDDANREIVRVDMTFENGVTACIEAGNGMTTKTRTLNFSFDDVIYCYDDRAQSRLVEIRNGATKTPVIVSDALPLTQSIRSFERAVRNNDTNTHSIQTGIEVVRVLENAASQIGEALPQRTTEWKS